MKSRHRGLAPAAAVVILLLLGGAASTVWATVNAVGVPRATVEAKSVREGSPKTGHSRGGRVLFVGGGYRGGK